MGTHQLSSSVACSYSKFNNRGYLYWNSQLTKNSLVITPFYILLNKSATLLDITFKRRKCHCCNNQETIIFTSVCIFLGWYNCCQKKKSILAKNPT
jgi:hypothetical protein